MNKPSSGTYRPEELSTLSLAQLRELRERTKSSRERPRSSPPVRQSREGNLALSHAQERLWFLEQLGLVGAAYYIAKALRREGSLQVAALEQSIGDLIRRHESLRTRFEPTSEGPRQIIEPPGNFSLPLIDLSSMEVGEKALYAKQIISEEAQRPFSLSSGPLFRTSLLRISDSEHVLLISMHHIVTDGWSWEVIYRELGTLYRANSQGLSSPLEELPIQYVDYAIWQRQWLQGSILEDQMKYWKERLRDAPERLELPTDRPRPSIESFKGATLDFSLSKKLSIDMADLGKREGATLFMVSLAAFQALLCRWSGQHDIVVGSPIAGRTHREIEGLIGFFVNTLALRTDLSGDVTFRQLIGRVKEVTLGAYAHQDLPFELLVKELRPERSLARQPIIQVMLALLNYPEERLELPGLTWSWADAEDLITHFDLTLYLTETGGTLSGCFEYATDLFDRTTIQRMAEQFQTLLESATASPDCPIAHLPILSAQERDLIVLAFNNTAAEYPEDQLVHQLFEDQARRHPDATAAVSGSSKLSYYELNERANKLAHYLIAEGTQPADCIPVVMPRSLDMLVAQLAILKCGATYVPLDTKFPIERTVLTIRDCRARRILVADDSAFDGPSIDVPQVAYTAYLAKALSADNPNISFPASAAAYVMYTSGSSGLPKGVVVPHRAIVRLAINNGYADVRPDDVIAHSSNPAFDASTFEIWGALLNGASVLIVPDDDLLDVRRLAGLIRTQGITILWITIGLLRQHLEGLKGVLPQLRYLLTGGDVVDPRTAKCVVEGTGPLNFLNAYGPTECTTFSTTYRVREASESPNSVPIGRPISNARIYVLDSSMEIVPIGVTGEIYIAGDGLASSYLNKPALTDERFITRRIAPGLEERLYRTGDLGRWRPDGNLEFLGRNDNQVKVRGFRIELGEIETVLQQHPLVQEVAVAVGEDAAGERRIVAYVVGDRSALRGAQDSGERVRDGIVGDWESLYEETYNQEQDRLGPTFVGWNSSYTGRPIPEEQMEEWLACTVNRIKDLQPKTVLEVGCGVGLLLQHIAPQCSAYVGTDFSPSALVHLREWVGRRPELRHVELIQREAKDLRGLPSQHFDTVVINSVVQYFPDMHYLFEVIRGTVGLLKPGGHIFIGDVRHLGSLSTFHSAVQLSKATSAVRAADLRRRIGRAVSEDKELVIDPRFFEVLPGCIPGVSAARVELKRGHAPNELTRYRYDVVLSTDRDKPAKDIPRRVDWGMVGSLLGLEDALKRRQWQVVSIRGIPNARLAKDISARRYVESGDNRATSTSLREQVAAVDNTGIDPEAVRGLGERCGYRVEIGWDHDSEECFEATMVAPGDAGQQSWRRPWVLEQPRSWSAYANDPMESGVVQQLIRTLKEDVKGNLPEYMIPATWVVLTEMPLTRNGKVDRRALPDPQGRPEECGEYVAPRNRLERALADIWASLLKTDMVGVNDNFFELGGHSLLATRLASRIRDVLNAEVSVQTIFGAPTITALASHIEATGRIAAAQDAPAPDDILHRFRREISNMDDVSVEARIKEIERELGTR